jgi:hypothetical protein
MSNAASKEYSKAAQKLFEEGKISFTGLVDRLRFDLNQGKPKPEKGKEESKTSMSELFGLLKPRTSGPLAPLPTNKKIDTKGMFSFRPDQVKNPFTAPGQGLDYLSFENARAKAVTYNLTVNVPYGATDAEIGRTLIKQIQAAEKTQGYTWRKTP